MHDCIQQETIGKFKEFMSEMKGFKATLFTIALAIIIQVGAFLYMWGGLTETVKKNTEHVWKTITPTMTEHTRNIDKILAKLDGSTIVHAHEKNALPELRN